MKWYWIVAIILGALVVGYMIAMAMPASNMGFKGQFKGKNNIRKQGYFQGFRRTVSIGGRGIGLYY